MPSENYTIYTTTKGDIIYVCKGKKSPLDFIVKYRSPGKRIRTPKHIHLIIDLYSKITGREILAMQFVDHIISLIQRITPATTFPPQLEFFSLEQVNVFKSLSDFGEYSVEFFLVVIELIMRQEKTNYPNGTLNLNVFEAIRQRKNIYSVVSTATFR